MRRLIVLVVILLLVLGVWSALGKYSSQFNQYLANSTTQNTSSSLPGGTVKVVGEESVTTSIVKNVGPSVVTISGTSTQASTNNQGSSPFDFGPFAPFFGSPDQNNQDPFNQNPNSQNGSSNQTPQPDSIGSGFIVSNDGLIVTNKHVVSDTTEKYQVITSDDKKYNVQKIYRDPLNDIAIVKIDISQNGGTTLKPVSLGDSSKLQVGQYACAIGTALGEFRNTVTTGVISGLGRGITAGDAYAGAAEDLNNVIQTSAAINPGNSGGPLINSGGQVIGINTAVAQSGQNVGFALPINAVKDSLNNFNSTGQFNRPYLGVAYKMISRDVALMNSVPQGAYVQQVVQGSPADKAGLQQGDIITKIDGQQLQGTNQELSTYIAKKKVGDDMAISYWRDNKQQDTKATLTTAPSQ